MRTPIAAGNWKMNLSPVEAAALAEAIKEGSGGVAGVEIVLGPPFVYLSAVCQAVAGSPVGVAGQDLYWEAEGAFTGEVSGPMLKQIGCSHCILGHSERRHVFGETNEEVNRKVKAALAHGLTPIMCAGETLEERKADRTEDVVRTQVTTGFEGLSAGAVSQTIVAYEPVWAIGTGETATPEQADEVHAFIRGLLREAYGDAVADGMRILYGGSVKPDNIEGLMAKEGIDGALVGGASLKADPFLDIIRGCAG